MAEIITVANPPTPVFDSSSLKSLIVRPILRAERDLWARLMARHHYLGFRSIVGESMRYVAILQGQWVALVGWGASAFKIRPRDEWIGWSRELQWQRLRWITNNVRFLILPGVAIPNLASKILAQNIRRLSKDWQIAHGHSILLAETFVDSARFRGTCYRAAGWMELGQTRGYGRNAGQYYTHGKPKTIFVLPLWRDARELLSDHACELFKKGGSMKSIGLSKQKAASLLEHLMRVPDPRKLQGIRHKKMTVLAIAVCAILCGARGFAAISEWGKNASQKTLARLGCRRDKTTKRYIAPSEPTVRRVLQTIDAAAVDREVGAWTLQQAQVAQKKATVCLDGKTLRGSAKKGGKQVQLLSAFLAREGAVIAQQQIESKSNEIPAVAPMLQAVDIQGMVVTADALHTQKGFAEFVVKEKKADYVLTVKDNQPSLKNDIETLRLEDFPPCVRDGG
jgi:hypothetical protein